MPHGQLTTVIPTPPLYSPSSTDAVAARRGNPLGVAGWAAVADALERVTSLTSLNGCGRYAAIRADGLREMKLGDTELGVWASLFLERSCATLTTLDVRCRAWCAQPQRAVAGGGGGHSRPAPVIRGFRPRQGLTWRAGRARRYLHILFLIDFNIIIPRCWFSFKMEG